jgi:uncharacterized repeat protein (TIGR03803 family)
MRRTLFLTILFCVATAIASLGQTPLRSPKVTFSSLISFDSTDGDLPTYGALVQGANGSLYGTTLEGGTHSFGTIFEITPSGPPLTTVYDFCSKTSTSSYCEDGAFPYGGLVLATNGNFYGTTELGGTGNGSSCGDEILGCGTVFELTPAGVLTTVYSFCSKTNCTDGAEPYGSLVQGTDGDLYGTTYQGGSSNYGTVFKVTTAGKLTTLHNFDDTNDGANPYDTLIQAANGDFYGTTYQGGSANGGTVFQITSSGAFTVLHTFCQTSCADGENPYAGVIQAANGDFYGTTSSGGTNGTGTVYQLTSAGKLTTLYSPGESPVGGVVQGTDGKLYGTTYSTIFDVTTAGKPTTLFTFDDTDGDGPEAALLQATNGTFYGTTTIGGSGDGIYGTVFSIANGLGAFVTTNPTSGAVGKAVTILGSDLTGATSVTFDGVSASFKVVSKTKITTTVPTGATTGTVEVVTPSKTLKSNVKFTVKG